jgi:hypothetical protein
MSSLRADDLKKWGPSIGFNPDSAGSISYTAGTAAGGDGTSNNVVNPAAGLTYASQIDPYNAGLLKRLQMTGFQNNTRNVAYGGLAPFGAAAAGAQSFLNQIGKNYQADSGAAAAARVYPGYYSSQRYCRLLR